MNHMLGRSALGPHWTGYFSSLQLVCSAPMRIGNRSSVEQLASVGVARITEYLVTTAELNDLTQVHHRDPMADLFNDCQVVADEQVTKPETILQVDHEVENACLDGHIEGGNRLISNDKLRLEGKGSSDADALALPPRELVWVVFPVFGCQAHELEQRPHLFRATLGGTDFVDTEWILYRVPCSTARIETRERILEDHLHLAPMRTQATLRQRRDVGTVDLNAAACGPIETHYQVGESRFSTSTLSNHSERFLAVDRQRDVFNRVHAGTLSVGELFR
nr:hypothetical protein [Rhodococcus sp. WS3]